MAYLKYSHKETLQREVVLGRRGGGIFEVFLKRRFQGDVLPDLVLPHWNSAGPGGGWKFYFTKKLNHLSPIRYPRAEWQQRKRELWTFNVFRRIAPLRATTAYSVWNGRIKGSKHLDSYITYLFPTRCVFCHHIHCWPLSICENWKRNDVYLSPSE